MKKITFLFICIFAFQFALQAQDRIYWGVANMNISSAKFDGTDQLQVTTISSQTYDMETDYYKNVLYWGEGVTVKKCNTDGTNVQTLYTGPRQIGGLALDLKNNKLYFSDYASGQNVQIRECNLDGTDLQTIVTSPLISGQTYNLSISSTLQKIYWTEINSGTSNSVLRCDMDGSNVETLMTISNFMPGLAIDEKNQQLYLAYWNDNQVMVTDMTCTTTPALVFDNSNGTFQMAINNQESKLYFAEMNSRKIRKCDLNGTNPQDIVSIGSGLIMALSIPTVPPAPTIVENETGTLKINDFLFAGIDKDLITKIQITAIPDKGTLYLDANDNSIVDEGEAVVLDQEINISDINAGILKFNPVANDYATPYTSFTFKWYNGTEYSILDYTQYFYVIKYVAGDISRNGIIDGNEIAGDINKDGAINRTDEVAGDTDGDGVIANGELAGDLNGNGTIDRPTEIAGDLNGNGTIDRPEEVAGDIDGDGVITAPELSGDVNGNEVIDNDELSGDLNGNGVLDDTTTGLKALDNAGVSIYPTITSDYINVTGENKTEVKVYNTVGSLILKTNENKINLGIYGKGTYLVKTVDKVTRVVVK